MNLLQIYTEFKETNLSGRYVTNNHIFPLLDKLPAKFTLNIIGKSVTGKPIYAVKTGTGKIKILMWSQMHGNEATTTKALFDLFSFLKSDSEESKDISEKFTLYIIPILNPDGAELYTRANANDIDLNRDSVSLTQPESTLLRKIFNEYNPDYCFNLHDQRTIFGVGNTKKPATVSFLAPAYDLDRNYNETRLKAVSVIVAMNTELQKHIPGQIGRFDDSFNLNCIGDMFQSLGVPTILFEAGHFKNDYEREETRKYIFVSILCSLLKINKNAIVDYKLNDYLNIPQNKISFFDFVYKKVRINTDSSNIITNFAAQYKEVLIEGSIVFEAYFSEIGDNIDRFGHQEYDCNEAEYSDDLNSIPEIDKKANFYLNKNIKFVNGLRKM